MSVAWALPPWQRLRRHVEADAQVVLKYKN
jgi:hypothetical protein